MVCNSGVGLTPTVDGAVHHAIGEQDGVPVATWDDGSCPVQLFSRWYGFSLTFPQCDIFNAADNSADDERERSPGTPATGKETSA